LQDIIKYDEIKLDWFFKMSLTHDIVNVSDYSVLKIRISHDKRKIFQKLTLRIVYMFFFFNC